VIGALALAVHLALGGAVYATSTWTSWATNIILVIVLIKLVIVAGGVVSARFALGHSRIRKSKGCR